MDGCGEIQASAKIGSSMKSLRHGLKGSARFLSGLYRSVYQQGHYRIKRGYLHRAEVLPHDDLGMKDEFQKEVFERAAQIMREHSFHRVIDIGCGSGFKLVQYLGEWDTIGIDLGSTVSVVRQKYPDRKWFEAETAHYPMLETDLIICADVIEHVPEPDLLLQDITSIRSWKILLLSTPERDHKRGWYHYGPPPNPSHYREWSRREIIQLLTPFVSIESAELINFDQSTLLVTCSRK
jgi:SAM-dependent methyltransferase